MITNYKNIKPSFACVFVQNGNSWLSIKEVFCLYILCLGAKISLKYWTLKL